MRVSAALLCAQVATVGMSGRFVSGAERPAAMHPGAPRLPSSSRETDDIIQTLQEHALPDLIQSLTEKKNAKRLRVVRMVGDDSDLRARPYLIQAYEESAHVGVRCKILESIGKLHDPTLRAWLLERLKDPSINIQCFAIWALGELKDPRTKGPLLKKLWSPNAFVQMTAIDALGKTGRDADVAAVLEVFLKDDEAQIRFLAAKALKGAAGADAFPALMQHLAQERSLEVQEALAETMGHVGGSVSAGHFIELLKNSPSQDTEHWAEVGLLAGPRDIIIPAVTPLLAADDFRLRLSASRILAELERNVQP